MDCLRWVEQTSALLERSSLLLECLSSIKQAVDPESIANNGLLHRSLAQIYTSNSMLPEPISSRPPFETIRFLVDSNYSPIVKTLVKRFPDLNEVNKVRKIRSIKGARSAQ